MAREFSVIIERDADGYFVASVPALRGCHTQATSLDELMARVREAVELCLEVQGESVEPLDFIGIQKITWRDPAAPDHREGGQQRDEFIAVVPVHAGETIGPGLLAAILRDCELERSPAVVVTEEMVTALESRDLEPRLPQG
jgi:predicted RNase H-like HicB family nuclease